MRLIGLIGLLLALPAFSAWAQPAYEEGQPVYMDADKLGYDQKNSIVVALGNVRVVQGQSTLYADRITYFQSQNVVRADGNVRVEDNIKKETYYADKVQLKDDLLQGVVHQFRIRMADNSQFAASQARRVSETKVELDKAVYSPCKICEGEDPFWQLKADEVHIDDEAQKVTYDDVYMELYGTPVLYSPYFSHPTPNADAKSGFLQPLYSQSSNLGFTLQTPYYFAIAPDKDATITPYLTTEDGPVMVGQYRQRTDDGFFQFDGSITNPKERDDNGVQLDEREIRGHIWARGDSNINEHWHWGFDVQRTTDDTYLRRYGFNNQRTLTSRAFTEGLYGRSYAMIEGLTFQGLDAGDDPDREPYVLPLARGYYESEAGRFGVSGMRQFASANLQALARQEGPQSRRLSVESGFKLPVATSGGHLIDASIRTRADVYSVENLEQPAGNNFDGEETRLIPAATLDWRYPLIRRGAGSSLTIEPRILTIVRPSGLNPNEVPNEDNQIVEFSEANLFEINPFPGIDTVDEGSRVAYGVGGQWWMGGKSYLNFLFGQSYSVDDSTPFPYNDEAGEHFSDYVGRVGFDYDPFAVSYQFRLDQDSGAPNNQTISFNTHYNPFWLNLDYVSIEDDVFLSDREEIFAAAGYRITDDWRIRANIRRDLILNTMLSTGAGITYENDCFTLDTTFSREFTRDRDIEPDDRVSVRVGLKGLTEL